MAGGLAALLDDVALIAKTAAASADDIAAAAAKTSAKAAGVVIDDAAVTPQFIAGVSPKRELPVIAKITRGSLFNKLVIILPAVLLLGWLAPWAITPVLTLGGVYLSYEGAEKVLSSLGVIKAHGPGSDEPRDEASLVKGAITTDLVLSTEIMVISLNEVAHQPWMVKIGALVAVAIFITLAVYGVVAILVKIDDVGLAMAKRPSKRSARIGRALVTAMPKVLNVIGVIGTAAMLWVGGHLVVHGFAELFWHGPEHVVEALANAVGTIPVVGGFASWCASTAVLAVVGLAVGSLTVLALIPFVKLRASRRTQHD